jgi:cysteine desulfurase
MTSFDAASGEPLHPAARQALLAALDDGWADPRRLYRDGRQAGMLLDAAREVIAESVGARPDEVAFTASGTQAAQFGFAGVAHGRRRVGRRVLVSAVEHSSVLHAAQAHERAGGQVTTIGVDRLGRVDLAAFGDAVSAGGDVALACLQAANHEVGTVQPVADAGRLCAAAGVPLLVDAAQVLGRADVPSGWSVLTGSAVKWGGPAGVGVLVVRDGVRFAPSWPVDEQEHGWVPGRVNVPGIVAAAAALRAREAERRAEAVRLAALVEQIRRRVAAEVPDVELVGDPEHRLPNLVTFSCLYVDGEALLLELDKAGFAVSSGSSCTADTLTPSHVLEAMGVLSHGNVRVSLPFGVDAAEVDRFLDLLPGVVATLRASAPVLPPAATVPAPATDSGARPATGHAATSEPVEAGDGANPLLVIDALGKRCPIPVIELARRIDEVPVGGVVAVLADDPAARLDVPAWCAMRGHAYLGATRRGDAPGYLVRRAAIHASVADT